MWAPGGGKVQQQDARKELLIYWICYSLLQIVEGLMGPMVCQVFFVFYFAALAYDFMCCSMLQCFDSLDLSFSTSVGWGTDWSHDISGFSLFFPCRTYILPIFICMVVACSVTQIRFFLLKYVCCVKIGLFCQIAQNRSILLCMVVVNTCVFTG